MSSVRINKGHRQEIKKHIANTMAYCLALERDFTDILNPERVYRRLYFSEDQENYFEKLDLQHPHLISKKDQITLKIIGMGEFKEKAELSMYPTLGSFSIKFSRKRFLPDVYYIESRLDKLYNSSDKAVELTERMHDQLTVFKTYQRTFNTVSNVIGTCNTFGQVRLLWPELIALVPPAIKLKLENTKARKLPSFWKSNAQHMLTLMAAIKKATPVLAAIHLRTAGINHLAIPPLNLNTTEFTLYKSNHLTDRINTFKT